MLDDIKLASLTNGERACLRLVARGYMSGKIARELGISAGTVDNYVFSARRKLDAPSRRAAARRLVQHEQASDGVRSRQVQPLHDAHEPVLVPGGVDRPDDGGPVDAVREAHLPYDAEPSGRDADDDRARDGLIRLTTIVGLAVGIVVLILALEPLARSAAHLAALIQPRR